MVDQKLMERLKERLGGIETDVMNGDNLAIFLCTFFDDGEEGDDDTGWSRAAIEGCNQVLAAIHQHYASALLPHKSGGAT